MAATKRTPAKRATKQAVPKQSDPHAATYTQQGQQTGDVYEVLTLNPAGRGTVHRVRASSKSEAERVVSESLGLDQRTGPRIAETASPADLRARERDAQKARLEEIEEARRGPA